MKSIGEKVNLVFSFLWAIQKVDIAINYYNSTLKVNFVPCSNSLMA